jgi:LCP family protein required for cell wall assembly
MLPIVLVAILGVLAIGVGALAIRARMTGSNIQTSFANVFVPPPEAKFGKSRILMLILGIDYDYDPKDQESSKNARSDSIMVAALDFPTKTFRIVSVPRDMDYINKRGQDDKINGAYTEGGFLGSDAAVGKFLGLPLLPNKHYFDRHVVLRINATKQLIDAIGGITVPVTETLNYDDSWGHLHIHFKPGVQHMNGDQAVSYSRFRHDACSDPCRIKRQQQIVRIMVAKLKDNKFNDIAHIGELIGVVQRNVITDLKPDEMTSLAVGFANSSTNDMKTTQIPYIADKDTPNGDVILPDTTKLPQIVATNLLNPFVVAPPVDKADLAKLSPRLVHVDVKNGSGTAGLATKMAADLKARLHRRVGRQRGLLRSRHDRDPRTFEARGRGRVAAAEAEAHDRDHHPGRAGRARRGSLGRTVGRARHAARASERRDRYRRQRLRGGDAQNDRARAVAGMSRKAVIGAVVALVVVLAVVRIVVHNPNPPLPAIVTPAANVHRLVGESLDARAYRLLFDRSGSGGRADRPKLIALTFDDGPYPVETPLLLDALRDLRIHATFFLIGRDAEQYPALARTIAADGNEIGNHTATHPSLDRLDAAGVRTELTTGAALLAAAAPQASETTLFRPPHGRFTETTLRTAQQLGYTTVFWNDDPGDWRADGGNGLVEHVLAHATAPDIVLLHSGKLSTVADLSRLVRDFRKGGFRFVTVGELLKSVPASDVTHPERLRLAPAERS